MSSQNWLVDFTCFLFCLLVLKILSSLDLPVFLYLPALCALPPFISLDMVLLCSPGWSFELNSPTLVSQILRKDTYHLATFLCNISYVKTTLFLYTSYLMHPSERLVVCGADAYSVMVNCTIREIWGDYFYQWVGQTRARQYGSWNGSNQDPLFWK